MNYGVAHLVFLHRKVTVEQVGGQAFRVRDRLFQAAILCATQRTRVIETGVRDRVPGRRAAARRSRFKRLSKGSPGA